MVNIFFSYASQDRQRVEPLVNRLEAEGYQVWWDRDIATGEAYDRAIEAAIMNANCVIVAWSHDSVNSEWVRNEADEGLSRGILIPILLDDVRPPLAFRRLQSVDFRTQTAADARAENELISAIDAQSGNPGKTTTSDEPTNERRNISFLNTQVTGFSALSARSGVDPEELDEIREAIDNKISRVAQLYGGLINSSSNNRYTIVFGVPKAHEDDALRGVHLAIALAREVAEVKTAGADQVLEARTAIATGLVVARSGTEDTSRYRLSGDCISTSELILEQTAPGEILISEATYELVHPYFQYQQKKIQSNEGGELNVSSITAPSDVHNRIEVSGARGFTPFKGRNLEQSILRESANRAFAGRGRTVVLIGNAGIGKSRLIREMKDAFDNKHVLKLEGTCQSFGARSPYLPFLDMLRELLAHNEFNAHSTLTEEDSVVQAMSNISPALTELAPLILRLMAIPTSRLRSIQLEGLALRSALQDALIATLTAAARHKPLFLLFEDWHWADTASEESLQKLIEVSARFPIFIALTCRPSYQPKWLNHSHTSSVHLEPFTEGECSDLISAKLQVDNVPQELVKRVYETSDGNPFFIEEICQTLIRNNNVVIEEGELRFSTGLANIEIPNSVEAIIRTRLDQMGRSEMEVLNHACVIGREFTQERLASTTRLPSQQLEDTLDELVDAELIQQTQIIPTPEYEFKHVLTQVVVYESLLKPKRRQLHQRVAESIEAGVDETDEAAVELLAHHYELGEDQQKAVEYTLRAGEKAARRSAIQEAASHFARASELISHLDEEQETRTQQLRTFVNLGTVLMVVKGYGAPEVIEAFSKARDLCQTVDSARDHFSTLWGLWRYYYNRASLSEARPAAEKLLDIAFRESDSQYLLAAHTALGVVNLFSGKLEAAAENFSLAQQQIGKDDSQELASHYGMSPEVMCLSFGAMASVARGDVSKALATVEQAAQLAHEIDHDATTALMLYYASMVCLQIGDLSAATVHTSDLEHVAKRANFPHWIALAEFQAAVQEAAKGHTEQAVPRMRNARDQLVSMGVGLLKPTFAMTFGAMSIPLGRTEEALVELDDATAFVEAGGLDYFLSEFNRVRGRLHQARAPEKAEAFFRLSLQQAEQCQAGLLVIRSATDLADFVLPTREGMTLLLSTINRYPDATLSSDYQRATRLLAKLKAKTDLNQ